MCNYACMQMPHWDTDGRRSSYGSGKMIVYYGDMEGIGQSLAGIVLSSTFEASSQCVILSFMHADAIPGTEKGVLLKGRQ